MANDYVIISQERIPNGRICADYYTGESKLEVEDRFLVETDKGFDILATLTLEEARTLDFPVHGYFADFNAWVEDHRGLLGLDPKPAPEPKPNAKPRYVIVQELPRNETGAIAWPGDPMAAVHAMCGR